jgi:hypothetical protein
VVVLASSPHVDRLGYDVRPVSAFLKICSKPRNLRIDRLTVGWKRRPPL